MPWHAVGYGHDIMRTTACAAPDRGRVPFFLQYLGARRRQNAEDRADLKVPEDLLNAALRFGLAPRRSPSSCAEKLFKIDPRSGKVEPPIGASVGASVDDSSNASTSSSVGPEVEHGSIFDNFSGHADGERRGAGTKSEDSIGKVSVGRVVGSLQIGSSPSACPEILKKTQTLTRP